MKSIIIEPFAGLANRMRVIVSGLWLQQQLNAKLTCVWNESNELNAPFEKLFMPIEGLNQLKNSSKYKYAKATNQPDYIRKIVAVSINKIFGIDYCIKEPNLIKNTWHAKADVRKIAAAYDTLYFFTCEEFGATDAMYAVFKPIEEIQIKIDSLTAKFNRHTVGIHVRRTDNVKAIIGSPIDQYIGKMDEAIRQSPDCNFYLATDDPLVEQALVERYGDLIITHKKDYSRETIGGMQDAVTDLFCLSRTSRLIGSYWSSFTDVAAKLGNIEVHIARK